MITDVRMDDWVGRINALLEELLRAYSCPGLGDLLQMVQIQRWHPVEQEAAESERQFLQIRVWAGRNGYAAPTMHQIAPPLHVASLVHRAVLRHLMVNLPAEERERLVRLDRLVPSRRVSRPQLLVDSHCHLDRLTLRRQPDWNTLLDSRRHTVPMFQYLVASLSFPSTCSILMRPVVPLRPE